MPVFPTQFRVTLEGTRTWLRDVIVESRDRVMWLVHGEAGGHPIGHVSLGHIRPGVRTATLLNVMSGDPAAVGRHGLTACTKAVVAWAQSHLGVDTMLATPFAENQGARNMLRRAGFVRTRSSAWEQRSASAPSTGRWSFRRRTSTGSVLDPLPPSRMKVSDHIADCLAAQGVDARLRGGRRDDRAPGRLDRRPARSARLVSMHHEQAAAFAAEGAGADDRRARRRDGHQRPGRDEPADRRRARATSTPRRPCSSAARSRRAELRGDRPVRQRGLPGDRRRRDGRADHQGGLARARRRRDPGAARRGVRAGARRAGPGPVLLDIPMDLQGREIEPRARRPLVAPGAPPDRDDAVARRARRRSPRRSGR